MNQNAIQKTIIFEKGEHKVATSTQKKNETNTNEGRWIKTMSRIYYRRKDNARGEQIVLAYLSSSFRRSVSF